MTALVQRSDHHTRVVSGELLTEFRGVLTTSTIAEVVAVARHDLEGQIVPEALQEMLHRLAHHRLSALCDSNR
ncbi:hypothetical protein [Umezawaea sp.]|uniref:hypothetical protein n=1 Tax=Umezawaea sp. TaxID=1955258 RepID=UPI002ED49BA8